MRTYVHANTCTITLMISLNTCIQSFPCVNLKWFTHAQNLHGSFMCIVYKKCQPIKFRRNQVKHVHEHTHTHTHTHTHQKHTYVHTHTHACTDTHACTHFTLHDCLVQHFITDRPFSQQSRRQHHCCVHQGMTRDGEGQHLKGHVEDVGSGFRCRM